MNEAKVLRRVAALRTKVFEHASTRTALPRPRRTRLALESLADHVRRLGNPTLHDDWEETYILFSCHTRIRPARIHGRLKQMEIRYAKKGQEARFTAFFALIKQTLHPDFITPHGYNRTFGEMADNDIFSKLDAELAPVVQLGKPIILYAGALLGHIREGRLIAHDDDVDFAVHLGECTLEGVSEKWSQYQKVLLDSDCLDISSSAGNSIIFKVKNSLGIDIDLFPAWTENGRFSVYPYALNDLPESAIFPLKPLNEGVIMLPQDAPALLAQSYGENWRVPDPLFHFDWPAARRRFAPLLQRDVDPG